MLGVMTKQEFQLKDAVPLSKPNIPATRDHPVLAAGHEPVQQPQGRLPNEYGPNLVPPGCAEAQGPHRGQTCTQVKSQAKELDQRGSRRPVSRVPHRYPGAAALRVRPRLRAPPRGYGPQVRSSTGTASRGITKGSRSTSSGTQPPPTTRRWGALSNSGETKTVLRWSPCSCAPQTRSTSPAPSTRAKSTMHGPYPNLGSGTARRPQLRVSSTSSTPDGARAAHGPPPQVPVPSDRRLRKPTPASTSSTNPQSPTTPPRPPHCKPCPGRTPKAQTSLGS